MDDIISRQAAIEAVMNHYRVGDKPQNEEMDWCAKMLNELPTAEKKGKWIPVTNGRGGHECDQCHEYAPSWQTGEEHLTNYCPNCGARMEESE